MPALQPRLTILAGASLALAVLAGCSSSNNKNANKAATVGGTIATATSAASSVRTPTPAPPAAASRTPTPAATAVRTPTPAAAALARTAIPYGGAPVATGDSALQSRLSAAALKDSDIPPGYAALSQPDFSTPLPGESAGYQQVYVKIGSATDFSIISVGLLGFTNVAAGQAAFKDLVNEIQAANKSLNLQLTPATDKPSLGDEASVYKVTLTQQGLTFTGYLVGWRRGRLGGTMIVAGGGSSAPTSSAEAVALAQKQDNNLKSVSQ